MSWSTCSRINALQTILVFLPVIILAVIGGAIGGLVGAIASIVVASIARKSNSTIVTFVICVIATGIGFVIWFILAMFVLAGLGAIA